MGSRWVILGTQRIVGDLGHEDLAYYL